MPNVPQLIRSVTQKTKVQQYIVEKDYALSYLLAAINHADGLGENLVLKGGTALKKLYFANYRFSEDLDYSTRVMGPIKQIDSLSCYSSLNRCFKKDPDMAAVSR
jgi:predicted nucleotidyltransferase component of viral defense system